MDAKGRRLRVLMMPDYRRDNPYQSLLAASLSGLGIDVLFPVGYRRGLPFWRATRDNRPIDVLHLHWTEPYTRNGHWPSLIFRWSKLLVDLAIVRISGVRVVWTLHNLEPHECRCPRLERFFRRRLAGRVSRLLVHGDESRIAGEMALGCPPEKMTVTLHGNYRTVYPVATPEMRREGRSGLASDHRVFLFFGMMRPYKGLERLLRVWRRLEPRQATLRVAGPCLDPNYEKTLRELVDETPGATLACGFADGEQVSRLFAAADVVVLPFERVQTSGSVILALSFGKPVIAPRLGEIQEALHSATDLMYEPGSDLALEMAIRASLEGDLDEMSRRSEEAGRMLAWEVAARQALQAYSPQEPRPEPNARVQQRAEQH